MSVKIIVESGSDINKIEAKELGIELISTEVNFSGEIFYDGDTIFAEEFFDKLEKCTTLPKTTQINQYRFEEKFRECIEAGDDIVCLTLSSGITSTAQSARLAAEAFPGRAYVVDTMSATAGMRILAFYGLRLIKEGKSAKEVASALDEKKSKIRLCAMVDTLKYLKMGGRVSGAAALIGNMINLKPMINFADGKVNVIGKCVGTNKAFAFIQNFVKESGGIDYDMPHCNLYSGNNDSNYRKFVEYSTAIYGDKAGDVKGYKLGATIGCHVGPGAVGLVFFTK